MRLKMLVDPQTIDDAMIFVIKHANDQNMHESVQLLKELCEYNKIFPQECKEHDWWNQLTSYQTYIKPFLANDPPANDQVVI